MSGLPGVRFANSREIMFSLKRGTTLDSNSRWIIFSLKKGKTLGRNSGELVFSPKSLGLSQRVQVQNV